jgi:hypothetical protein
MKLYKSNNGRWFGTQADAKRAVGTNRFGEVNVPTDKLGLIDWLNAEEEKRRERDAHNTAVLTEVAAQPLAEIAPEPVKLTSEDPYVARIARSIDVEDEIAKADYPNALRLADHATSRVAEHLRDMRIAEAKRAAEDLI